MKHLLVSCALSVLPTLILAGGVINWAPETFPGFLEQHPNQCAGVPLRGEGPITVSMCQKDLGYHPLTRFRTKGNATQEWFVEAVGPKAPYYRLRNHYSDQCMSIAGVSSETIQQALCDDTPGQLWDLQRSDDSFQIVNSLSGLCMQVENAILVQTACREQNWTISGTGINPTPTLPPPSKQVQFRPYFNKRTDLCVKLGDTARITNCNDPMPFVRIEIVGSYYRLVSFSKCLAIASLESGNNRVIGKDCNATDETQQWEFLVGEEDLSVWQSDYLESLGADLQVGLVRLRNRANQRCLAAQTISQASAVTHRSCVVTYVAILWMLTAPAVLPDQFSLQSKLNPALCAEIRRGRTNPGSRLSLKACHSDTKHQHFSAIGNGDYYSLAAGHTESSSRPTCIAVRGGRAAMVGSQIIQVKCRRNRKKQQWKITADGMLENRVTKLCIGVEEAVSGVDLVQFPCDANDDKVLWNAVSLL